MAIINGTEGNDVLNGTSFDDVIDGGNGSDTIFGNAGNDELRSGVVTERAIIYQGLSVIDVLYGGDGDDHLLPSSLSADLVDMDYDSWYSYYLQCDMYGGAGNDALAGFYVLNGIGSLVSNLYGGEGDDYYRTYAKYN